MPKKREWGRRSVSSSLEDEDTAVSLGRASWRKWAFLELGDFMHLVSNYLRSLSWMFGCRDYGSGVSTLQALQHGRI